MSLSTKRLGDRSVLDVLHQSGSFKCLFPRALSPALDTVLLNTAGGVTGGDSFRFSGTVTTGTTLTLTTQACERIYKAKPGPSGQVTNHLTVGSGARMNWLPQETILFNGCALDRRLLIEMAPDATTLLVEPLVFGRAAMGETLTDIRLRDRIEIRRDGMPIFLDSIRFSGDMHSHLSGQNIANGSLAMALIIFAGPSAEGQLDAVRRMLPDTAGASLIGNELLIIRMLAPNSFTLRKALLPVLRRLNNDTIPRCWML